MAYPRRQRAAPPRVTYTGSDYAPIAAAGASSVNAAAPIYRDFITRDRPTPNALMAAAPSRRRQGQQNLGGGGGGQGAVVPPIKNMRRATSQTSPRRPAPVGGTWTTFPNYFGIRTVYPSSARGDAKQVSAASLRAMHRRNDLGTKRTRLGSQSARSKSNNAGTNVGPVHRPWETYGNFKADEMYRYGTCTLGSSCRQHHGVLLRSRVPSKAPKNIEALQALAKPLAFRQRKRYVPPEPPKGGVFYMSANLPDPPNKEWIEAHSVQLDHHKRDKYKPPPPPDFTKPFVPPRDPPNMQWFLDHAKPLDRYKREKFKPEPLPDFVK